MVPRSRNARELQTLLASTARAVIGPLTKTRRRIIKVQDCVENKKNQGSKIIVIIKEATLRRNTGRQIPPSRDGEESNRLSSRQHNNQNS